MKPELQKTIEQLPDQLQEELMRYAESLLKSAQQPNKTEKLRPVFGSGMGKYTLAPDFDEPLDDFKDYM